MVALVTGKIKKASMDGQIKSRIHAIHSGLEVNISDSG